MQIEVRNKRTQNLLYQQTSERIDLVKVLEETTPERKEAITKMIADILLEGAHRTVERILSEPKRF